MMKNAIKILIFFCFSIYFGQNKLTKLETFVDSIQKDLSVEIKNKVNPVPKKYLNNFVKYLNKEVKHKILYKKAYHISYQLATSERNFQLDLICLDLLNKKKSEKLLKGILQTKVPYNFVYYKKNNVCYIMIVDFILLDHDKLSISLQKRFHQIFQN